MKKHQLIDDVIRLFLVLFLCFISSMLIKAFHYLSFTVNDANENPPFFTGIFGTFCYLLPLYLIWYFPLSVPLRGRSGKQINWVGKLFFHFAAGFILSLIFIFIFGDVINMELFLFYLMINVITSIIFTLLNKLVNHFFT